MSPPPLKYHVIYQLWFLMVGISKMTSVFLYKPPNLSSLLCPHLKYHRIYQFWQSKCGDLKKDIRQLIYNTKLQRGFFPPPLPETPWGGGVWREILMSFLKSLPLKSPKINISHDISSKGLFCPVIYEINTIESPRIDISYNISSGGSFPPPRAFPSPQGAL